MHQMDCLPKSGVRQGLKSQTHIHSQRLLVFGPGSRFRPILNLGYYLHVYFFVCLMFFSMAWITPFIP